MTPPGSSSGSTSAHIMMPCPWMSAHPSGSQAMSAQEVKGCLKPVPTVAWTESPSYSPPDP